MAATSASASNEEPKKEELKKELEDAGLPSDGTKAELLERVDQLDRVHVPDVFVAQVKPKG